MEIKKIIYHLLHFNLIRNYIAFKKKNEALAKNDDKKYLENVGYLRLNYKLDLDNPKTFNEKINWYKLNYCTDLMKCVVDKEKVKEYIIRKGLSNIVIPTIKVYDNIDDVKFSNLPNKFVIKNTMDSGGVFVCKNKELINIVDIKNKLNSFVNNEFVDGKHWARESAYTYGVNRIIVEKLIETIDGHAPWDYKFFCFNGEPKFFIICRGREEKLTIDFYDINCNLLDVKRKKHTNSGKKIENRDDINKMISICRILSRDFPFVRVDLYCEEHKVYFSELTFYPSAGFEGFKPAKWDKVFGDMWDLSTINLYKNGEV